VAEALAARDEALAAHVKTLAERETELRRQAAELERRAVRIDDLERVLDRLSERSIARERELTAAREQLGRERAQTQSGLRQLAAVAEQIEEVRRQARGQATRIRLRALREAAELTERAAEAASRPAPVRDRLLDSLHEAIARIGAGPPTAEIEPDPDAEDGWRHRDALFDGMVEVEVGPLADFSQLVGFEDAASEIGATSEISVRRFARGRATVELRLDEPVELLRELEERAPFEFRVRDRRTDRLVLDVDAE
jgi:hypothetical protein